MSVAGMSPRNQMMCPHLQYFLSAPGIYIPSSYLCLFVRICISYPRVARRLIRIITWPGGVRGCKDVVHVKKPP